MTRTFHIFTLVITCYGIPDVIRYGSVLLDTMITITSVTSLLTHCMHLFHRLQWRLHCRLNVLHQQCTCACILALVRSSVFMTCVCKQEWYVWNDYWLYVSHKFYLSNWYLIECVQHCKGSMLTWHIVHAHCTVMWMRWLLQLLSLFSRCCRPKVTLHQHQRMPLKRTTPLKMWCKAPHPCRNFAVLSQDYA